MALSPEKYAEAGTEHAHQVALFMWAASKEVQELYPQLKKLYAIPNGGERNVIVANRLRAEGVKSGFPDIGLPVARHGFHGLFIELKRPKTERELKGRLQKRVAGKVSEKQSQWINDLREEGFAVAICIGFEEARKTLLQYMKEKW